MGSILLVDLAGAVALLLWGLNMVHTGIIRTFGSDLRRFLNYALRNRVFAFAAGLVLTSVLQSSTATALMTTSLAAEGLVGLMPALAIMLGANVGTTLIVQVLSFNIYAASPALIVLGLIARKAGAEGRVRDFGRVLIGLGLMVLALHMLLESLMPAESAPAMRAILGAITGDPILCILIAGLLTWVAHSSVAIVLLVMSLAQAQFVTPAAAIALVLGANLGSAINPLFEAGRAGNPADKRLPLGNFLNRAVGVLCVLPFIKEIAAFGMDMQSSPALLTSGFHIAFNVVLAVAFIGPLPWIADLLVRLLPEKKGPFDPSAPRYLDEAAFVTPAIALSDAARETLRIGDIIETMLQQVMTALLTNEKSDIVQITKSDDVVDRLEQAVRLFVTKLTREDLSAEEARRATEIISFAINLEHAGDIIDKNLRELAIKKIKKNASFSDDGAMELDAFYKMVLDSFKLSIGVFMNTDAQGARLLILQKAKVRRAEREGADKHLQRLREGRPESVETTSLHIDVLRDLKRIHSHIASVAYSQDHGDSDAVDGALNGDFLRPALS